MESRNPEQFGRSCVEASGSVLGRTAGSKGHGTLGLLLQLLGFYGDPGWDLGLLARGFSFPLSVPSLLLSPIANRTVALTAGRYVGAGAPGSSKRGPRQAGCRQGAGRALRGSVNHSPHLLCLKALPGDSPVPSTSASTLPLG